MEFGYSVQGYVSSERNESDPDAEHTVLTEEFDLCVLADKVGVKYAWVPEHHFTEGYSHVSANDIFLGALAKVTSQIHLSSGIWNPLPRFNHPATLAEKVAMLDHLSDGRVEFGTGRGSGSQEVVGFYPEFDDASNTRVVWEETINEFVKMWTQPVYEGFQGEHWSLAPRPIIPKPYHKPHPAMWYAAGNPSSYVMAAQRGLGILGFTLGADLKATEENLKKYRKAIADAEPVGAFVNNNLAIAVGLCYINEDRDVARREFLEGGTAQFAANALRYHDQIPRPDDYPVWPDLPPEPDEAMLDAMIDMGAALVGDPDDVLKQVQRWVDVGIDQVMIGTGSKTYEQNVRMLDLFGKYIIPKVDTDPVHSTTRYREAAALQTV